MGSPFCLFVITIGYIKITLTGNVLTTTTIGRSMPELAPIPNGCDYPCHNATWCSMSTPHVMLSSYHVVAPGWCHVASPRGATWHSSIGPSGPKNAKNA
jgi:hypothetical protein